MTDPIEKFGSELVDFRAELLQRFRQIKNVIENSYHNTNTDTHVVYDAVLKLTQPSWLHEQFDDLDYKLNRTKRS